MFFSQKAKKGTKTKIQTSRAEAVEIWEVLTSAMSHAVEIDVTTCIHSDLDQVSRPNDSNLSLELAAPAHFSTQINLLDGTVNHEIDLKLIDNDADRELQRWHIEQVKQKQDSLIISLQRLEEMRHLVLKPKHQSDW